MKNKVLYNLPYNLHRYILLLGMFVMGLMYVFPLADLRASVYANNTTQDDLSYGFTSMFKEVTFLLLFGVLIFIFLKEFKIISMPAILIYGVVVLMRVGIPFPQYFDYNYVFDHLFWQNKSNLLMRFTYYIRVAGGGDDPFSAKRCEVGQILCVATFCVMLLMIVVTSVMLIKVYIRKYIKKEEGEFY